MTWLNGAILAVAYVTVGYATAWTLNQWGNADWPGMPAIDITESRLLLWAFTVAALWPLVAVWAAVLASYTGVRNAVGKLTGARP